MSEEILVTRESIKLNRLDIIEAITNFKNEGLNYPKDMKIVNIRGTNASGKSTVPLQMLAKDRGAYILTKDGKDVITVFPGYGWLAIGKYKNAAGGLDTIRTTDEAKELLKLASYLPYNILFEGILCSTVFSTWAEQLKIYSSKAPYRKAGVLNIVNDLEVVKERLMKRNGGKEVKFEQIESKWRTVKKNVQKFKDEGLASWETNNMSIKIEDTLDWFFKELEKNMKEEE